MEFSDSKVAIVVLLVLLGIVLIVILIRVCYRFIHFENQDQRNSEDRIKSQLIQMALFNATTTTMQPITVSFPYSW